MHRLFSNETETLTLYDQQKWSLSIVSAEWGGHTSWENLFDWVL